MQESQGVDFFRDNLVLIGLGLLLIFGYLVMIIRKRSKHNFVHPKQEAKDKN